MRSILCIVVLAAAVGACGGGDVEGWPDAWPDDADAGEDGCDLDGLDECTADKDACVGAADTYPELEACKATFCQCADSWLCVDEVETDLYHCDDYV